MGAVHALSSLGQRGRNSLSRQPRRRLSEPRTPRASAWRLIGATNSVIVVLFVADRGTPSRRTPVTGKAAAADAAAGAGGTCSRRGARVASAASTRRPRPRRAVARRRLVDRARRPAGGLGERTSRSGCSRRRRLCDDYLLVRPPSAARRLICLDRERAARRRDGAAGAGRLAGERERPAARSTTAMAYAAQPCPRACRDWRGAPGGARSAARSPRGRAGRRARRGSARTCGTAGRGRGATRGGCRWTFRFFQSPPTVPRAAPPSGTPPATSSATPGRPSANRSSCGAASHEQVGGLRGPRRRAGSSATPARFARRAPS